LSISTIDITPSVIEDAPAIAAVHVRSWQAAYANIFEATWLAALSVETRAKRWHDIIAANESHTVVSNHDGRLTGFVSFGKCRDDAAAPDQGEIFALYVTPEMWRSGCGRALLSHAVTQLRADGFTSISLWVLRANHRGISFYEACGFEREAGSEKAFDMGGRRVEEVTFMLPNTPHAARSASQRV
jgi:ribosomal protein S18 acetylase RimI-like enzyme